mgnify:CR=1 FL=1
MKRRTLQLGDRRNAGRLAAVAAHDYEKATCVPPSFVSEHARIVSASQHAWQLARAEDDFAAFAFFGVVPKVVDDKCVEVPRNSGGKLVITQPWPSMLRTLWGDDDRYQRQYFSEFPGRPEVYFTGDGARQDKDGYFFILGRTDDVINVAGHRLGTREIEESISSHANVAEVAVVGVADSLKGQVAMAFAVLKDNALLNDPQALLKLEGEIMKVVDNSLGAVARPSRVRFVSVLPKTRSGKLLRRAIQAVCEGRDPGDLTTMDDPAALLQISDLVKASSA